MNTQNTLHSKMPCFSATFQPSNSFIKNNQIRPMRSLANRIPFSISILPWRVFWGCASDWTIFFAIPFSLFVTLFLVKQIVLIYYCQEVDLRFFWIMAVLLCIFYNNNNITYQFYINIKYTYSIEFLKKKEKKDFVENHMKNWSRCRCVLYSTEALPRNNFLKKKRNPKKFIRWPKTVQRMQKK